MTRANIGLPESQKHCKGYTEKGQIIFPWGTQRNVSGSHAWTCKVEKAEENVSEKSTIAKRWAT